MEKKIKNKIEDREKKIAVRENCSSGYILVLYIYIYMFVQVYVCTNLREKIKRSLNYVCTYLLFICIYFSGYNLFV
jgi:hypothetical protein